MLQILKAPQFIAAIITGLLIISVFVYVKNIGREEVNREILEEKVRIENALTDLEKEIITLDYAALLSRYCVWMRDASKAQCVQANLSERQRQDD